MGRARARVLGRRRAVAAVDREAAPIVPALIVHPVAGTHAGPAMRGYETVTGRRIRRSQKGWPRPILIE